MLNHTGAHRIELNVAHTGKKVVVIGHQAPFISTNPQGPALVVTAIDIGYVIAADKLRRIRVLTPYSSSQCQFSVAT